MLLACNVLLCLAGTLLLSIRLRRLFRLSLTDRVLMPEIEKGSMLMRLSRGGLWDALDSLLCPAPLAKKHHRHQHHEDIRDHH
jgi:hypothetical protein